MRVEKVLQTKRPLSAKIASGLEKLPQKIRKIFFCILGSFWVILQFTMSKKNHFKKSRIVHFQFQSLSSSFLAFRNIRK